MNRETAPSEDTRAQLARLQKQITELEAASLGLVRPASMLEAEGVLFSTLMDNIPDNIYFKDRESRFLMINRALADRFGLKDPAEAAGRTDSDFFRSEHAIEAREDELEIMRTGIPIVGKEEHEVQTDGSEHWVSTTKLPLRDKNGIIVGTFGISRDATRRKLAEKALIDKEDELLRQKETLEDRVRERTLDLEQINRRLEREAQERVRVEAALRQGEERYRRLLASTPTYVYTVRMRGGVPVSTEHGAGCVAVTGYTAEEYASNNLLWIHMVHPEDKDTVLGLLAIDMAGEKRRPIEHRIIHKDGSVKWVRNTIVHHFDENGQLTHYDGLVEDITERKLSEEAVRDGERLNAMSSLAAGAALSFNAVLGVISGSASSVADNVLPGTAAHRDAQRIMTAVSRASDLTRRLLGMASAFGGEQASIDKSVSLHQVVKDAVELVEQPFADRNIRIRVKLADTPLFARASSAHVADVLMSVLSNSADAMPDGGLISLRTRVRQLRRPSQRHPRAKPGPYAVLYVSNTGGVRPAEHKERTAEPFFDAPPEAAKVGLGLTITRSLLESWGGWISVRSCAGKGTLFGLFFPMGEAARHVPAAEEAPGGQPTGGVLVMDDDQATLDFVSGGLERSGYKVHVAKTASEALALYHVKRDEIAVFVVDAVMPNEDGRQVLESVLKDNPKARILVTSGFSRDYVRHHLPMGAWHYLQKPFEREALLEAVIGAARPSARRRPKA